MRNTVLEDARQLASGTVARLCGSALYTDIESYQHAFVAFLAERADQFETWIDAHDAFTIHRQAVALQGIAAVFQGAF